MRSKQSSLVSVQSDLYLITKIEYYKSMKRRKPLTEKQYAECYAKFEANQWRQKREKERGYILNILKFIYLKLFYIVY